MNQTNPPRVKNSSNTDTTIHLGQKTGTKMIWTKTVLKFYIPRKLEGHK